MKEKLVNLSVRLKPSLHKRLVAAKWKSKSSLNAEINSRLQKSFERQNAFKLAAEIANHLRAAVEPRPAKLTPQSAQRGSPT